MFSTFSNILISVTVQNIKCTMLTLFFITNICTVKKWYFAIQIIKIQSTVKVQLTNVELSTNKLLFLNAM